MKMYLRVCVQCSWTVSHVGGDFPRKINLQHKAISDNLACAAKALRVNTCSGLRPGGTQAYSSRAQPESSSEVEFLWKSYMSLVTVFSISTGMAVIACSSRRHLQCTQIFLPETQKQKTPVKSPCQQRDTLGWTKATGFLMAVVWFTIWKYVLYILTHTIAPLRQKHTLSVINHGVLECIQGDWVSVETRRHTVVAVWDTEACH